jgi:ubiquitin carboxyl-terminal hydrolase 34
LRQEIFAFYRSFAQLTAFFVELDLRIMRNPTMSDQTRFQALASPPYLHALGALTRREEVTIHTSSPHLRNGDDDWSYLAEMSAVVDTFQNFPAVQGGSLSHIRQLATLELRLVSQFPRLATDNLGNLCLVAGNIMKYVFRRAQYPGQQLSDLARRVIARMYPFFTSMAAMLSDMVDKNLNQLSPEGAGNLIEGLTEIYQTCLATGGVVPPEIINQTLHARPPVAGHHVPEAVAYHWKFTHFGKLIRSGQMQLRVMAVSTMCSDLVALYRKNAEPLGEDATAALLSYIADFLLSTGLVNYVLGPTCHPEITLESSNIIGFLVVSDTYSRAHTDALWQTVTSTQDPRVSDALIRMIGRIANLFPQESMMYFLEKLNTVPVEVFGSSMREFCDQVFKQILTRFPESLLTDSAPFDLCIRLIRQSSALGPQSSVAYPDIQQFAIQKFDSILSHGPDQEGRWKIYRDCLSDIAARATSTIGSLWVLKMTTRYYNARDLHELASEHDLTKLLIEELAAAVPAARAAGFPAAISGAQNAPRKELLMSLIYQESASITKDLGPRLWGLLVGAEAVCQEDRDAAWQILTLAMKRSLGENGFAAACFAEYLPALDPKFFCQGTLDFVREGVMPLVNDPASIVLDDDENPNHSGIEMLWRLALTAPTGTVEKRAIHALVSDVYIESRSIQSFSPYRARKVHLALVDRCLRQLSSAAARLKTFANGTANGDDDSMVIIATDQQIQEQELLFVRSLAVLREFHHLHQARPEFSAPDMRSLILESPKDVEGEPAELKYQSFDGDTQTTVMPLNIGKRNTAASLLASLREATGFESYRIYYRGRPFVPQESDICRSLEDLQIHNGIILVKKEPEAPASPRVPQGASPVEIEILSHFDELWEYLSMDEKLAREVRTPAVVLFYSLAAALTTASADLRIFGQAPCR